MAALVMEQTVRWRDLFLLIRNAY